MSFYGKTFFNLINLLFTKKTNDGIKKIEFGYSDGETEIQLGRGLALNDNERIISTNLELNTAVEGTTLKITFGEQTGGDT